MNLQPSPLCLALRSPLEQCVNIETLLDSVLESLEAFEVVATVDGDDFGGLPAPVIILSSDSKHI